MRHYIYQYRCKIPSLSGMQSECVPLIRYCVGCNTIHIGSLEYDHRATQIHGENAVDLAEELFRRGKVPTEKQLRDMATYAVGQDGQRQLNAHAYEELLAIRRSEAYGQLMAAHRDYLKLAKEKKCPVCAEPLSEAPMHYLANRKVSPEFSAITDDGAMETEGENAEQALLAKLQQYIRDAFLAAAEEKRAAFVESHGWEEAPDICEATQKLRMLYAAEAEAQKDALASEKLALVQLYRDTVLRLEGQIKALEQEDPCAAITWEQFPLHLPEAPTPPKKPAQPALEKPGFWGKKKVLAANAKAMQQYEQEKRAYDQALEAYNKKSIAYTIAVEALKDQRQARYAAARVEAMAAHQQKLAQLRQDCEAALQAHGRAEAGKEALPTEQKVALAQLRREIDMEQQALEERYAAQK